MVKKSSIFEKLKNRWRSPAGVRFDRGRRGGVGGGDRPPDADARAVAEQRAERLRGRKLSAREEAVVTLGDGLRELSGLVRGVHTRMDDQSGTVADLAEDVKRLPQLGQAQLDLLKRLEGRLAKQTEVGDAMIRSFSELPDLLRGVQGALNRAAATDERTAKTLGEFRSTMDRVQTHMGRLVESSQAQASASADLVRDQRAGADKLVDSFRKERARDVAEMKTEMQSVVEDIGNSQREGIDTLRRTQQDQATRLGKLVADGSRTSRATLVMMILSFVALVAIFFVMLAK